MNNALQQIQGFQHARNLTATNETMIVYESISRKDLEDIEKYRHCPPASYDRLKAFSSWLNRNQFDPAYKIETRGNRGVCVVLGGISRK